MSQTEEKKGFKSNIVSFRIIMMHRVFNIIYSIWFNFRYLPFSQAIKLPILIGTNMRVEKLRRGQIIIEKPLCLSIILGRGKSPSMNAFKGCIHVSEHGKIILKGHTSISEGTVLRCDGDGIIELGESFYCNCNCYFRSGSLISFGNACSLGWNVVINTSDGHQVWHNGIKVSMEAPIVVGNHVWLTSDCSLLKNTKIPNNCIVAQKAVVTKSFNNENCLIGGIPAREILGNIEWQA